MKILLVDDQPLLLMGFRLILEGEPDFSIVGEAQDGEQAVLMPQTAPVSASITSALQDMVP